MPLLKRCCPIWKAQIQFKQCHLSGVVLAQGVCSSATEHNLRHCYLLLAFLIPKPKLLEPHWTLAVLSKRKYEWRRMLDHRAFPCLHPNLIQIGSHCRWIILEVPSVSLAWRTDLNLVWAITPSFLPFRFSATKSFWKVKLRGGGGGQFWNPQKLKIFYRKF